VHEARVTTAALVSGLIMVLLCVGWALLQG
jgi:hypothetical protein